VDQNQSRMRDDAVRDLILTTQFYRAETIDGSSFETQVGLIADTLEALSNGHGKGAEWLNAYTESALAIREDPGDPPKSTVGEGLLVQGTVAVFYGQAGLGKTWLLLQLAQAIATGSPWLGLPTIQARVGYLSLELPRYFIGTRLSTICETTSGLDSIQVICRPTMKGMVDLLHPLTLPALTHWVKQNGLGVVILDPLSRAHTANENAAQEMGQVLSIAEQLAAEGPLVILNHHEGHPNPETSSQHPRGSSRLLSDPNTVLNLGMDHGHLCVKTKKVNLGIAPDPIYVEQIANGTFEPIDRPASAKEAAEDARTALAELIDSQPGLNSAELTAAMGIEPTTGQPYPRHRIDRYLKKLAEQGVVRSEKVSTRVNDAATWHTVPLKGKRRATGG